MEILQRAKIVTRHVHANCDKIFFIWSLAFSQIVADRSGDLPQHFHRLAHRPFLCPFEDPRIGK